ncbi:MAG: superoxide dismutase family protein [Hyphomicrobium sp.]
MGKPRPLCLALSLSVAIALASGAPSAAEGARAELKRADGSEVGIATFTETPSGLIAKFELKGLPPGPHGVHVHEVGKCEGDFASAGGIYNPLGAKHGFYNEEGPMAGDLANVYVGQDGTATAEFLSPFLTLNKETEDKLFDADGASLILFEKSDDYLSEPEGGAGQRLACGVIKSD